MRKLTTIVFIFFISLSVFAQQDAAGEQDLVWHTSLLKASELSKAEEKPIFAFFTGSDWCGWCHRLQKNVFAKSAFITWAKENVILLELDFPKYKQLPPDLAQQNAGLQRAFKVSGYPTVWLFTMTSDTIDGKHLISALGKCGYPQGGVPGKEEDQFLADVNAILTNKK